VELSSFRIALQHGPRRRRACGVQQAAHGDAAAHRRDLQALLTAMRVRVLAARALVY
jgi:hypothetical protein